MNVTGGWQQWLSGKFKYNKEKLKPEVSYELDGDTGKVWIS